LINLPIAAAPIPWQQFVESLNGMVGNARQNVGEPGYGSMPQLIFYYTAPSVCRKAAASAIADAVA
jgi:hypothetical protein